MVALLLAVAPARAQDASSVAAARTLAEEGNALFKKGKYAEACEKLSASFELSRQATTSGRLAQCYEKVERLASAWAMWRETAVIAGGSGVKKDKERASFAKKRAEELDAKVPRLTISVSSPPPGLSVERDGKPVSSGLLGSAVRVDRGSTRVVATAPGYQRFEKEITVENGKNEVITVRLEKGGEAQAPAPAPSETSQERPPAETAEVLDPAENVGAQPDPGGSSGSSVLKWTGIGLAGAGAVVLIAGGVFEWQARSLASEANDVCPDRECSDMDAVEKSRDAKSKETTALILGIAGAATVAAGLVLFLIAPDSEGSADAVAVTPAGDGLVIGWRGTF